MANITGFYRPGQAGGSADLYAGPSFRTPQGRSPGGGGFLDKLMNMKLKLAQEQLLQMQQQREQTRKAMMGPTRAPAPAKGFTKGERQVSGPSPREWQLASDPTYMHAPGAAQAIQRVNEWMGPQNVAQMMMQKGKNWGDILVAANRAAPGIAAAMSARGGGAEPGGPAKGGGAPIWTMAEPVDPSMFLPSGGLGGLQTKAIPPGTSLETYGAPSGVGPEGPQLPRRGVQARAPGGYVLSQYKEGTLPGTVPKTGKATVHEGEIVIPKAQVTPSLMSMLIEDAQRKGTLKKPGTLKAGYQGGTLPRREPGEEIDVPWYLGFKYSPVTEEEAGGLLERGGPWLRGAEGLGLGEPSGRPPAEKLGGVLRKTGRAITEEASGFMKGLGFEPGPPAEGPESLETILEEARAQAPVEEPEPKIPEKKPRAERDRLYDQLRGMPEQVQAQHKAKMSEIEAERLLDILRFNRNIDPEVAKSILDKVAFNMKISDKYSGIALGREKAIEEELKASASMERALTLASERERLTGERQISVREVDALMDMQVQDAKQMGQLMLDAQNIMMKGTRGSDRQRALAKVLSKIREANARYDLGLDEGEMEDMAYGVPSLSTEQIARFARELYPEGRR